MQMFSDSHDDQGASLVKRQVEENLRRAYEAEFPETSDDRFADLLRRLKQKQTGSSRQN